jgi:hypothetical protein
MAATNFGTYNTLYELKNAHDPSGNLAKIVDILWATNSVLRDAYWEEANDITSHVYAQTVVEPTGEFGVINKGVAYEDGITTQVREHIGMLESYSKIDERLLKRARNKDAYRAQRNAMTLRGMTKKFHDEFFYGTTVGAPEGVDGIATRINGLSDWPNSTKSAGGSGNDNTSIYVIKWGPEGVFLVYPRGDGGGQRMIEEKDMGLQKVTDTNGVYYAWETHFMLNFGLCIADPRAIQRYCNLEVTGSTNIFDEDHLIEVLNRMEDMENVVIYCNRTVKTQMDIALKDKNNVNFSVDEAWGKPGVLHFKGVPVRLCDQIVDTEDTVS